MNKIKKVSRFFCLFILFYFVPIILFSDNIKKADKLYKQLDYKYALEIYEKVMRTTPSLDVAQKIANCYRFINNTEAAEIWYKKVLEYPEADNSNYKYCADALKQNGKYEEASKYFLIWGEKDPQNKVEAHRLANICTVADTWLKNPDIGAELKNEIAFNSENSDFSPVIFEDNLFIISDRWQAEKKKEKTYGWTGNPYLKIYDISTKTNQINLLSGNTNKNYHSGPIAIYPSRDTLIFSRTVPSKGKQNANIAGQQYLLLAVKKKDKWIERAKINLNKNGAYSVQHPSLSPDGNILYFASNMPGGFGGMDLYYAVKQAKGLWSEPINCGNTINTSFDEVFPAVRQDGKFYFASKGHIGMGGLDIFSADGSENNFTNVENLRSPLNSPKDDFGIVFKDDLKTGYLSSNRVGGVGLDDIYSFKTGIKAEPKKEILFVINGIVVEKQSNIPLSGIEVVLVNNDNQQVTKLYSDANGKFNFNLEKETDYTVSGNAAQFFTSQKGVISTKGLTSSTMFDVKFELERSIDTYTIKLNNIFYDFNKWNIRKDAVADLNKVNSFMNEMPNVNLDLIAHTDSRGSAKYNLNLSQKRANSAKEFLVKVGTAEDRLTAIGKGETELLNQCADGVKCTLEQHQLNRRTEFKIVKVKPVLALASLTKK